MIWNSYRKESFAFKKVRFPDLVEVGEFDMFTSGSLEFSSLSTLKASGTLSYKGTVLPDDRYLVRIYYTFIDEQGAEFNQALGTFFMSLQNPTYNAGLVSGEVSLTSVLKVPNGSYFGRPYVIPAGTDIVKKASDILKQLGLKPSTTTESYVIARDRTYTDTDSWLNIVNDLLAVADMTSATPDAYGNIVLSPYIDLDNRPSAWTFADDETSIMEPDVAMSDNRSELPNAVKLYHSSEEVNIWAAAYNRDASSDISLQGRGYEICLQENIFELKAKSTTARLNEMKELAKRKLINNTSRIQYIEIKHPFLPIEPAKAITVSYKRSGISWKGSVTEVQVEIAAHCTMTTKARRFTRSDYQVSVEGAVW